jgi:Bacterial SH3 domain
MRFPSVLSLAGGALALLLSQGGEVRAATYGCFKVTAHSLNIRSRPSSKSEVQTVASKSDILEKRKFFCTIGGIWCAVRYNGVRGYADRAYMKKVPCP